MAAAGRSFRVDLGGASNVVALDVLRADARDGGFDALRAHVRGLDVEAVLPGVGGLLDRAVALGRSAAGEGVRQATTGLYNVSSAAALAWEAVRLDDPARLALAGDVLRHRVMPRDLLGM